MKFREFEVPRWLLFGNNGAAGLPNTILTANDLPNDERIRVRGNELVHIDQQIEFSSSDDWTWRGYFKWLIAYIKEWWEHGYWNSVFEIDSRTHQLTRYKRPVRYWEQLIKEREEEDD